MKIILTIILSICAIGVVVSSIENQHVNNNMNQTIQSADAHQTEIKMTVWFDEFNKKQNEGMTMENADKLAIKASIN